MEEWLSEVDKYANENTSKLLVGNKADLTKQVPEETAQVRASSCSFALRRVCSASPTSLASTFSRPAQKQPPMSRTPS